MAEKSVKTTLGKAALRATLGAGLVALAASGGGCYERTIRAKGIGADQYQVQEPYQENSKLDDWVFGERPDQAKSSKKSSSK